MNLLNRVQQLEFNSGSGLLLRAGKTGILCGVVGRGFYDELSEQANRLIKENGFDRIIVEVEDWHLRLMKQRLKNIEIKEICSYRDADRLFIEVELIPA